MSNDEFAKADAQLSSRVLAQTLADPTSTSRDVTEATINNDATLGYYAKSIGVSKMEAAEKL